MNIAEPEDLLGADLNANVQITRDILSGKEGPKRDIVVLNAAAALFAADKVGSIKEGIPLAQMAIDSGKALGKLQRLEEFSKK